MYTRSIAALVFAAGFAFAQEPAFEVASIKPAPAINPMDVVAGKLHVGMKLDAGRVDIGFMSLADLIRIAWEVKPYQVSGPDWMSAERFDVVAKIPDGAAKEQVPAMLRTLLAERFKLTVHKESREHSVYALVVAKGGPKLKDAPPDSDPPPDGAVHVSQNPDGRGATVVAQGLGAMKVGMGSDGNMHMEASKVTMAAFAEMLTRFVDRPVVDDTGLKGNYQVALDLQMADLMRMAKAAGVAIPGGPMPGGSGRGGLGSNSPADAASDPDGSSPIFAAVQALGLKLEPRKEAVETIIVDHAEKTPTEN